MTGIQTKPDMSESMNLLDIIILRVWAQLPIDVLCIFKATTFTPSSKMMTWILVDRVRWPVVRNVNKILNSHLHITKKWNCFIFNPRSADPDGFIRLKYFKQSQKIAKKKVIVFTYFIYGCKWIFFIAYHYREISL